MTKNKIKLIIFDLSNVCFSMEEPPFIHDFCLKHDLDEKVFDQEYQELLKKAEVDEISGEQIWKQMLPKYGVKENPEKLIKEMIDSKYEHPEVLAIAKELKNKGLPVVYLTNYNKDYWELIVKRWNMDKYFSFGIVSYQIKARKPAPEGFKKFMEIYQVKPKEILFIDDSEKNLAKAREYGIQGHLFRGTPELADFLKTVKLL